MIVELLKDEVEWDDFVLNHPEGTIFHTTKWKKVIEESLFYDSRYLTIKTNDGVLIGICPFFLVKKYKFFRILDSLPYADFAGPLFNKEFLVDGVNYLKLYLNDICKIEKITYTRIKIQNIELYKHLKQSHVDENISIGTMNLCLKDNTCEYLWSNILTSKNRKYIRRFEKEGFSTRIAQNEKDFILFYSLHCKNIAQMRAKPLPYIFYKKSFDYLFPDYFNLLLIEKNSKCVGAGIFYIFPEKKSIYMAGVGMDKTLNSRYKLYLKIRWETIKYVQNYGISNFSFGSTPSDKNSSNYKLKEAFGAEFTQDYLMYNPINLKFYVFGKSLTQLKGRISKISCHSKPLFNYKNKGILK